MTNPNGNGLATGTYTLNGNNLTLNVTSNTYNGQTSNASSTLNCTINGSTIYMDTGSGYTITLTE